jgi:hypothetical protein
VRTAIEGDASSNTESARNEALASALLNATTVSKVTNIPYSTYSVSTDCVVCKYNERGGHPRL